MKPSETQVNLLLEFKEILGVEWVEGQIEKYIEERNRPKKFNDKGKAFSPLVSLIGNVLPGIDGVTVDELQLLRLCYLADAVCAVTNAATNHLEDKLDRIRSANSKEVESTLYEFIVGAILHGLGHSIDFIQEIDGERTPDILVDGVVEIECKQRSETNVEKYQNKIWEEVYPRVQKVFFHAKASATVEIYADKEVINRNDINEIIKKLKSTGDLSKEMSEVIGDVTVTVRPVPILEEESGIRADPPPLNYPAAFHKVEMLYHGGRNFVTPGSGLFIECAFGGTTLKGREVGIPSRLKTVKKQISGDKAAIAFVDLRFRIQDVGKIDFDPAIAVVDDWLRQNSALSAVVLTTPVESNIDGKKFVGHHIIVRYHDNPRHELPEGFLGHLHEERGT